MAKPTDQYGPPKASRRKPVRRMLLPTVLALIGVSAAMAYVLTTGGPDAAASSTRLAGATSSASASQGSASPSAGATSPSAGIPGATPVPNSATTAAPQNAAALAVSGGALPLQSGQTAPASAWAAGRGGTELAAVSSELGKVTQAAGMKQYVSMKAACVRVTSDVKTAQAGPPIPAAAMQALYAKALTELATGGADCQSAISQQTDGDEYILTHENPTMLNQSTAEFAAGAKGLFQATAEIEIVGPHH